MTVYVDDASIPAEVRNGSCFRQVFPAPLQQAGLAPPDQEQVFLAPAGWGQKNLLRPWQSPSPRCQRPIRVGPELLRKRSWWGQEKLEEWGRKHFAESAPEPYRPAGPSQSPGLDPGLGRLAGPQSPGLDPGLGGPLEPGPEAWQPEPPDADPEAGQ
jgi:hypothetical protein